MIPKFRGWDTYEKEMLENVTPLFDDSNSMMAIITDFQIKGSPGTSEIEIGSYDTTFNWDEFPYVIMQSTGLKDKNGVEIFEGDVLYYIPFETHINNSIIVFEKGSFCKKMLRNGKLTSVKFIDSEEYEVIGNIHENPELLEEENNG
ncbi:YopX family protein [Enterococcus faecalis]|uniref:YopX family protein n=1 Tax=Enterococcus faecalis TaxID=1351 RepID=UPI0033997E20